jgi:hypothetical protein
MPDLAIFLIAFIAIMLMFANFHLTMISGRLKRLTTPPTMIAPADLDTADMRPGPIVHNPAPATYKPGDRVRIKHNSGFSRGMTGVVDFQEPNGDRCWVTRDGSGGPAWFWNRELEAE